MTYVTKNILAIPFYASQSLHIAPMQQGPKIMMTITVMVKKWPQTLELQLGMSFFKANKCKISVF